MDVRSLISRFIIRFVANSGLAFCLGAAVLSSASLADINAGTNSEDRFWINRTHDNLAKFDNYQAQTEQTQTEPAQAGAGAAVISDVLFKKTDGFYQVVLQPDSLSGIEVSQRAGVITLHDKPNQRAFIVKGLEAYQAGGSLETIKDIYLFNKEHYEQTFTPSIHVADRLAVGIDFVARDESDEIRKIEAFVDYHHSLFMQARFVFNNGVESTIRNNSIEFNKEGLTLPEIKLPQTTQVRVLDLSKKALSQKELSKKTANNIVWPEDKNNTWGFSQRKFYQQSNSSAAYYYGDKFFLLAIATPERGQPVTVPAVPLTIGNTPVLLSQFPLFAHLAFDHKGISYTLVSNAHPESLLSMVKGMTSAQ